MFGTVVAMPISGLLCQHGFPSPPHGSKWPSVFYVFGIYKFLYIYWYLCFIFRNRLSWSRVVGHVALFRLQFAGKTSAY